MDTRQSLGRASDSVADLSTLDSGSVISFRLRPDSELQKTVVLGEPTSLFDDPLPFEEIETTSVTSGASGPTLPESTSWRITRSWELVSLNLENVGVDFFLRVFDERPDFLELFRFGGATFPRNEHGQRDIPAPLKKHALTVMKTIGECVSGLSRFEDLVPKLRSMGQVHATVGVQSHHYDVVLRHLIDAIAAELGPDEWDGETRDAWELAFRSIIGVIKHPNELLQLEPLEGWGMANALACLYITLYTPFRMAGFTARHDVVEDTFNVFTSLATACLALDMATGWIVSSCRTRDHFPTSPNILLGDRQWIGGCFP